MANGRDGCGFGAENPRAKGDGSPLMQAEEGDLFGRPAAFGPMAMSWRGFCAEGGAVSDGWERFAKPTIAHTQIPHLMADEHD
jgi:hypothetical protein